MKANWNTLHRLWMLLAQAVTVGAGLLIAWHAFGPASPPPARNDVVTIHEAAGSTSLASTILGRRDTGYRSAARKASASVVNIYTRSASSRRSRRGQDSLSLGSGVIVAAQGYILTNNHVVDGATEIAVMLPSGKVADAQLLGRDPDTDLAVLKVDATDLPPITFAEPGSVQVGDIVLAVGDPFGVGQTVTQGIVSATGRNRLGINTFENFIQTDAAINPGNSGGALVDIDGNLVGINAAIFSESGGSQGIGFAIPVSLAREVMDQIIAHGRVERGWIGVVARDAKHGAEDAAGAVVEKVQRGGPGERAGLRVGDTVTAMNGKGIADATALINETAMLAPGSRVEFKVTRHGVPMAVAVELGRRPMPAERRR
ncbi:S1C family serine protease [Variovorax sp. YR216]|uniref:S1C family serine protease n=1 Tax=Variovorax sp. YR216 TaxID=1882828 RepID=UPI00089BB4ED|nr:trypsin-like peptidase domain-containing protein [Variovorax sp. YR216]SEB15719.1 serine protease DegQ [Variovorax sp. YR216]